MGGYSVCLWTEFGDCISGGLLDFVLFLPLLLPLLPLPLSSSQLIYDILDHESTSTPGSADLTLGKPGSVDLRPDQLSMLGRVSGDGGAYKEEV